MTAAQQVSRTCWCGANAAHCIGQFPPHHPLVQCDGCSVFALHPQPSDAELAAAYANDYYGSSRRKFIAPIAALVRLFQGGRARMIMRCLPSPPEGRSILDVGCGNGGFLAQLKRRGYQVQGTEWTADSAARVPGDLIIPVYVGDLIDLDLPAHSFDAITLWHVFEHLRQPRETLLKIRTLLRPGGVLIMSMPNAESAQAQRYGTHWFHHDPPRHLFGFGPHSITLLLEDAGFAVSRISTWSFEQNPFGEIQSELNMRLAQGATVAGQVGVVSEQAGGRSRDRLYNQLKGTTREPLATRLCDLAQMIMLLPMAIVRDIIDSSRGDGATMTLTAIVRD